MSYVMLVAADHPLPLYDSGIRRSSASTAGGACVQVETPGFSIQPHQYYRDAVEALGLEMKLWQYELNVEAAEAEAEQLRAYLKRSCRPGETIELWNLWVGDDREEKDRPVQGRLGDLDRGSPGAAVRPSHTKRLPRPVPDGGHHLIFICGRFCPERRTNYAKQSNWTHQ